MNTINGSRKSKKLMDIDKEIRNSKDNNNTNGTHNAEMEN